MNRGFVVVVSVVTPGREVHPAWGPGRGGRVRWEAAGLVEDEGLAFAMARLLRERSPAVEARVVPVRKLVAGLGGEEAERVLDHLRNRTTADLARAHELAREAARRWPRLMQPRSEIERRKGGDRRAASSVVDVSDRRVGGERRSGADRRARQAVAIGHRPLRRCPAS